MCVLGEVHLLHSWEDAVSELKMEGTAPDCLTYHNEVRGLQLRVLLAPTSSFRFKVSENGWISK